MNISIIQIITGMLAPGLMISACGLLLLGMNSRYSLVINRIRELDKEKRMLSANENRAKLTEQEHMRLHSVIKQIIMLHFRLKLVRNAVVSYSIAVALFITSSIFIGLHFIYNADLVSDIIVFFFLTGMLCVMVGVILAATETMKGYEIVKIELD
jgi:hypothetical protein